MPRPGPLAYSAEPGIVAVRPVDRTVPKFYLSPAEAREHARVLTVLADQAERLALLHPFQGAAPEGV